MKGAIRMKMPAVLFLTFCIIGVMATGTVSAATPTEPGTWIPYSPSTALCPITISTGDSNVHPLGACEVKCQNKYPCNQRCRNKTGKNGQTTHEQCMERCHNYLENCKSKCP